MKKKLLHVCLSPSEGGLELYAVRLASYFKNEGYESLFVCRPDTFIQKKVTEAGLKSFSVQGKDYFSWHLISEISNIVRENKIDTIIVQRLKDLWITYWVKKKNPNLKIIGFNQMFVDYPKKDLWHKIIYKQIDTMVALTHIQKDALLETLPVPKEKFTVIPNGVDSEIFKPCTTDNPLREEIRAKLGIKKSNELLVGLIGRFDKQKGQIEFIDAIKNLKKSHPHIKYVLVGADTYGEEPIQRKILGEILEHDLHTHTQVRGFTNNVKDIMCALDIFIMPSYKETFGIVLIEAMSCEKICISTRSGGPIEILNEGECGLLIEPKSSKAIEDGIIEVNRNLNTYKLKAQNARKRVLQRYQVKDALNKIQELMQ